MGPWWQELSDSELMARLWQRFHNDPIDEPWMRALVQARNEERVIREINIILGKEPDV